MSKQNAVEEIASLVEQANVLLKEAKELANAEGIQYYFEDKLRNLHDDVSDEYVDWYASGC